MFDLFIRFPPEIQDLILEQCLPNDKICLGLTCKFMYSFIKFPKSGLFASDSVLPSCTKQEDRPTYNSRLHRQGRHAISLGNFYDWRRSYPEGHGVCTATYCKSHCDCLTCPLFKRLRTWFPKDLKYCSRCNKFTKRDKRKTLGAGRCLHGQKHRLYGRVEPKFWTHRKGRGFGRGEMWRKWYTETNMKAWSNRLNRIRAPNSRYNLRARTGGAWKYENMYQ